MEDWLKCQISSLVKYRQNQKNPFIVIIYLTYIRKCVCEIYKQ